MKVRFRAINQQQSGKENRCVDERVGLPSVLLKDLNLEH